MEPKELWSIPESCNWVVLLVSVFLSVGNAVCPSVARGQSRKARSGGVTEEVYVAELGACRTVGQAVVLPPLQKSSATAADWHTLQKATLNKIGADMAMMASAHLERVHADLKIIWQIYGGGKFIDPSSLVVLPAPGCSLAQGSRFRHLGKLVFVEVTCVPYIDFYNMFICLFFERPKQQYSLVPRSLSPRSNPRPLLHIHGSGTGPS